MNALGTTCWKGSIGVDHSRPRLRLRFRQVQQTRRKNNHTCLQEFTYYLRNCYESYVIEAVVDALLKECSYEAMRFLADGKFSEW